MRVNRSRFVPLVLVTALVATGLSVGAASAGTGSLELIATAGAANSTESWEGTSFSDDGSRVAYTSSTDGQVYVLDRGTGVRTRVSARADGTPSSGGYPLNSSPRISRNGRFVTFVSMATNLSPADPPGDFLQDIYLKDTLSGAITLVSTNSAGEKGNLPSFGPAAVSDDGATVVFASRAGNFPPVVALPPGCPQPEETYCIEDEIYAKNLSTGALTLLSLGSRGDYEGAVSGSIFAALSADGTIVALGTSDALTPDDTDVYYPDVFVRNLTTGAVVLGSNDNPSGSGSYYSPALSADGTVLTFEGQVAGSGTVRVWSRDLALAASVPTLVSQAADGQVANGHSAGARISPDGTVVAFYSGATNLDPGDTDSHYDVYLKHLATGALALVSQADDGTKGNAGSGPEIALNGSRVIFSSSATNLDPAVDQLGEFGYFLKQVTLATPPPPPPADANGDGVIDTLQPVGTAVGAFVDASTSPATTGSIVDANGLTVAVTDADAPDGVLVTVGSGSGQVTLSVCGLTVRLGAGSSAVLTCGSVIVRTITGSATVVLDGGLITVVVPAGASARISDTTAGAEVSAVVGAGVTVTVNGTTTAVPAGAGPASFNSWVATGFSAPVDNAPMLNSLKAGRAVPLKWRLVDAAGQPVTNLTTATVSVQNYSCGLSETADVLEQTTAGGSGLQNLGNGYYQLNWKTSTAWSGSCKTMRLDLGGGVALSALFTFTR